MKKGWEIKKLGEVCDFEKTPNKKNLPYIGLEHIESNSGKFIGSINPVKVKSSTFHFTNKHVLYGRLRPYLNKVLMPSFEGHCSTEIFPIKPKENLAKAFLFHWLLLDETMKKINATWTGARMPRANMNAVLNFEIPIPPLSEQHCIVSILDKVFRAINKAKENTEKNLQNARELFESFLQSVFENKSEGWEEKALGEVCSIGDGNYSSKYPKSSEFVSKGIPFLTATNLKNGTIISDGIRFISKEQHHTLRKGHIIKGDLVIVVRGSSTGNNSIVPNEYAGSNLNSQLAFLRVKENKLSNEYLFAVFNSPMVMKNVKSAISGAAQPQLPNNKLLDIKISYPSIKEQQMIVNKLDNLSLETKKLEAIYKQKLTVLNEIKKSILQKAFNGELKTKDTKQLV